MSSVKFSESVIQNADKIVHECMGHEDAFCMSRCPMSTDVKAYIGLIAERRYEEALKVIREKLFLPNTLGRICAHPCENACRREMEFHQPMAIAALKRFAAEQADDESLWDLETGADTGKRIAIVGSGPAGAQAAIDLRKAGHEVTIYEKMDKAGGMLRIGIPVYRLPREIIDHEYRYLDKLGIKFRFGVQVGRDCSFQELREQYDAVLIAAGAQKGNVIKVPGYDAEGVFTAVEFLREVNETKDFKAAGRRIMVIGGGDVAMDCARSAVRLGNREVYQCSLENLEILPASDEERDEALEEGVQCNFGWGPAQILEENGAVKGIVIQEVTSVYDAEGRFAPQYGEKTKTIEVDTVIMATGQIVEDITDGAVKQIGGGRYQVDPDTLATEIQGVFAAGDAAGGKIVVEAMALGRKAAVSIDRFVCGRDLKEDRDLKKEWAYETKLNVPLPEGTKDEPRVHKNLRPVSERIRDFEPIDAGFSEEDAVKEASRCLKCECRLCMKECVMMNEYGSCPEDIFGQLASEGKMEAVVSYSCNDCDGCTRVCPLELPIKEIFMEARRDFVKANYGQSPMKGHRAVNIHQELGFYSMYTAKACGGENDDR
ncbi:oxidoreductase [Lachnoclostridium sp. An169]|uniref:FAD-dependent oxidoreductase n=1 Tax=Lachnoclostridium sp. An169 TaxID=1965569 RepID=UPI000B377505|nr:FAD-dependent oxidoreductase [Lachnoclostridium sp. An169]OUP82929.1 oxidoreductase [Lachnoclostridium sp. An169]